MIVPFGAGFKIATGRPDILEWLGRPMLGGRGSKIGIVLVTGGRGDGGGLLLQNKKQTNNNIDCRYAYQSTLILIFPESKKIITFVSD